MIGPIKTVGINVEDQQKALDFYTQKLGFVVRRSIPMGPGASWIEVSPPGAQTSFVGSSRFLVGQFTAPAACR
jgi:lactoylglutathione lyase